MRLFCFVIISVFFVSCKNAIENSTESRIQKFINIETENCLIIPREGCGGCISDATAFAKRNLDKYENLQIIFTGIEDLKELKYRVGKDFLLKENVSIDSTNLLMDSTIISSFPQLLFIKNKKIVKIEKFDIQNINLPLKE